MTIFDVTEDGKRTITTTIENQSFYVHDLDQSIEVEDGGDLIKVVGDLVKLSSGYFDDADEVI